MVKGWAPNTEKMKAAMNDDMRTSATPYCCVVSIKSNEKAIPGRTLKSIYEYGSGKEYQSMGLLGEKD